MRAGTTRVGQIIGLTGYTAGRFAGQSYSGPVGDPNQRTITVIRAVKAFLATPQPTIQSDTLA